MFSPMVAIASAIAVSTVTSPTFAALILSRSAPTSSATCAIILTSPWNCSLRATKSVSELTSTTTPLMPAVCTPIRPSAAIRPAFFAAFDSPFLRSQSIAACMSPSFSASACLQSIMPMPVVSRRSLTIAAVIVAIVAILCLSGDGGEAVALAAIRHQDLGNWESAGPEERRVALFGFRGHRLGLGHPAIGARRKSDFFADLVGGVVIEFGELPIVEDAEVVELLLDRAGHAGELLEGVGSPPCHGQALEADRLRRGRNFLPNWMGGGADIHARIALRA